MTIVKDIIYKFLENFNIVIDNSYAITPQLTCYKYKSNLSPLSRFGISKHHKHVKGVCGFS